MAVLVNLSNGKTIAQDICVADTFLKRLVGLMFQKELSSEKALIIENCNAIHTFFMRFPIDVLFVDKNNRVVKVVKNFKPWRISAFVKNADYVVELASGSVTDSLVKVGDQIKMEAV